MEDLRAVAPAMVALLELTEAFAEQYRQEKLRRNSADFSDQEHLALGLLVAPDGGPTELGGPGGGPVSGDPGGRVPGHQRGAECHLPGGVQGWAEHLHRGRRQAEHLSLPPGGPHHFPGEDTTASGPMRRPPTARSGRSCSPRTSAPGGRSWTLPTSSFPTSCLRKWGRWTTARMRRFTSGAEYYPERHGLRHGVPSI